MATLGTPILIDGSQGEGGGALYRTAVAMSALTMQPLRINNIRGGTNYPGLDIEDLVLTRALARSCSAEVVGGEFQSSTLSFLPTKRATGLNGPIDLEPEAMKGRAPNANVVLCSLLPVLTRSGMYSRISLGGETYGTRSLSFDYFANVTLPALQSLGLYAFADQTLAGFGRDGGGEVTVDVEPSYLEGLQWPDRGELVSCRAAVAISELSPNVAQRAASHLQTLASSAKVPLETDVIGIDSHNPGFHVTVWAEYERGMGGATAMGVRGVKAEHVAQAAFDELLEWMSTDATVDPFLADQIVLPAALSENGSAFKTSRLTKRFLTIVSIIKQFIPIHITVKGSEGEPGTVTIRR